MRSTILFTLLLLCAGCGAKGALERPVEPSPPLLGNTSPVQKQLLADVTMPTKAQ